MIYLSLFILSYIVNGMEHTDAGVMAQLPSDLVEFDETDPIASHPLMKDVVNSIIDKNIRRGLTNPNSWSVDNVDIQRILDSHNNIRSLTARGLYEGPGSSYQPQGCNMNALSWSKALEKAATDWSGRCYFEHNDNRANDMRSAVSTTGAEWIVTPSDSVGENLYVSGADPAMNAYFGEENYGILGGLEDGWCFDEAKKYTYTPSPGASGTGHYTQVIWANTRYVGCGFQQCSGASTKSGSYSWAKTIFTCNYFPAGNYYGQNPYKRGAPCTCCDDDRKECTHDGGLCGGGWNANWNNPNFSGDKTVVDRCEDGAGRYVCQRHDTTERPSERPTERPTVRPTDRPTTKDPTPAAPEPTSRPTERPTDRPTTKEPTDRPTTREPTTPRPSKSPTTKSPTFITQPSKPNTYSPSNNPTNRPSRDPSMRPTQSPTLTRVTAEPTESGETMYVIRVITEVIWLTRSYDFENVEGAIEELMFQQLTERYLGLSSSVDSDGKEIYGPYCPRSGCSFIYGFVTLPMVIQGATEQQKEDIKSRIEDGSYQDEFCEALTLRYQGNPTDRDYNSRGLQCYRVTAEIESITQTQYNAFIGDLDNDGVPFDTFNLESYSGADIFVLLIFLSFICCACWCIGWYSHKKKFQKELEKELNLAANFNQQQHETDIRRQMAANSQPDMFERGIGRFRNN